MVLSHPQNRLSKSVLGHLRTNTLRWIAPKKYVEDELYISNFNCIPPPWFIPLVSLAIIGVFIWYAVELANAGTPVTWLTGVPTYSPLIYCPSRRYEAWRYITYALMHSGCVYLSFNNYIDILSKISLRKLLKIYLNLIIFLLYLSVSFSYQHIVMNLILQIIIGVPLEWVFVCLPKLFFLSLIFYDNHIWIAQTNSVANMSNNAKYMRFNPLACLACINHYESYSWVTLCEYLIRGVIVKLF